MPEHRARSKHQALPQMTQKQNKLEKKKKRKKIECLDKRLVEHVYFLTVSQFH